MTWVPDHLLDHLARVADEPDLAGTPYRLECELGRGGIGIVYQVWDMRLERSVALKVVEAPNREAKILAHLEHPGIVPVYDAGSLSDGRAFYAMRLVRGARLDEFLHRELSLPARLRVFEKVCDAVAFAHDRGVVHFDLKPQNIMTGSFGEVFVMDWGIPAAGTAGYLAPESTRDHRGDVFSLGRILWDVTARERPRALAAIIERAAADEPDRRYQNATELAADVTRFLDGLPVSAYRESTPERLARFVRRNQVLLLLLAAYVAVKLAIFFLRPA
jgi:eukaryotic-like serine/threonine-protein kinase